MQITDTIKARRSSNREQALMLLDTVPLSDTESKYNLLAAAAHYLNDAEVLNKWIGIAVTEINTRLCAEMLNRITGSNLQAIPDPAAFMQMLVSVLQQNEGRDTVLWLLGKLSLSPAGDALGDRMVVTFWRKWNDYQYLLNKQPVSPELAEAASIMYAGVLTKLKELDPDFRGKQYPDVPKQMNKEALQQRWPFTTEMWEEFAYKHFPVNDAAQKADIALYQRTARNMESGKWDDGYTQLKELLTLYPQTRFVKEKQDTIEKTIKMIEERR